jgi:glycosyltransferase involved in cell wall biosynthesis
VIYRSGAMALRTKSGAALVHARAIARRAAAPLGTELAWLVSRRGGADLAVFHELSPSPGGGGHQFLRALLGELRKRDVAVELNRISASTPACLFNSFNFDFRRLRRFTRSGVRMVHRVDGPIGVYRGFDDGTDRRIVELNGALADATILQSQWSLQRHRELGYELRDPHVIRNAVDPSIFHRPARREPLSGRRLRVVATAWSDNPRKGADALAWLDHNLDRDRVELTLAGRSQASFEHVRVVGPLDSHTLGELLRTQDVYLAASRDDPCSNALLEALACGLPAAYLRSGGHPELVGDGGIGFDEPEELPDVLDRLVAELEGRRAAILVPDLGEVADRYLDVLHR